LLNEHNNYLTKLLGQKKYFDSISTLPQIMAEKIIFLLFEE